MPPLPSRRRLLKYAGAVAATALLGRRVRAAPKARVESVGVVSKQPRYYHGWPTLARRRDGQLLLVCSGGREAHVCPFGRVEVLRSRDDGATWTWPQVLLDSPIDDRDASVVETAKGSLLVTTFTSLAFEPVLEKAEARQPGEPDAWPKEKLERWRAARDRLDREQRRKELGVWMIRSTDGGVSWSARYDCLVNSPHGPVPLSDGRLLYAGKELWKEPHRNGVCVSEDDGRGWKWLAEIPTRPGDDAREYHELHAVEAADGRLVVHVRNHNKANAGEVLQSESGDGGKTWSEPRPTGVWGYPSHLLRLRDGRLLMTYGHRRKPLGNQARLSADHGKTWSEPLVLSDDGVSGDLGYPSTAQLEGDRLLTVWYEVMPGSPPAVLRQARWKIA
jgi:sialidase-1